jgi:uncharacterized membrane protein
MEIYKEWEQLNQKIFSDKYLKNEDIMNAITSESKSAIHQIKRGLKIKSLWVVGFIVLFSTLMFLSREIPEATIAVGIINFIYVIFLIVSIFMVRGINENFSEKDNVLQNLQLNARIIKKVLTFEELIFAFNAPLITMSSLFWASLRRGNTLNTLLHDSRFLTIAIVMCVISVPLVYFPGKYLNKKSFGNHLDKLNDNINKLHGVEMIKDTVN